MATVRAVLAGGTALGQAKPGVLPRIGRSWDVTGCAWQNETNLGRTIQAGFEEHCR